MEKASAKKVTALCSTAPRNDVITKEMVALVKNKKSPMPPKPYEGRSDLTLWDKATQFPPAMPDSFAQGLHQRVPVTIVSLMQH